MCFRPAPVSMDCSDGSHICCQTCGMPVDAGMNNCPYCGDPIPQAPPDDFTKVDPSQNVRII